MNLIHFKFDSIGAGCVPLIVTARNESSVQFYIKIRETVDSKKVSSLEYPDLNINKTLDDKKIGTICTEFSTYQIEIFDSLLKLNKIENDTIINLAEIQTITKIHITEILFRNVLNQWNYLQVLNLGKKKLN